MGNTAKRQAIRDAARAINETLLPLGDGEEFTGLNLPVLTNKNTLADFLGPFLQSEELVGMAHFDLAAAEGKSDGAGKEAAEEMIRLLLLRRSTFRNNEAAVIELYSQTDEIIRLQEPKRPLIKMLAVAKKIEQGGQITREDAQDLLGGVQMLECLRAITYQSTLPTSGQKETFKGVMRANKDESRVIIPGVDETSEYLRTTAAKGAQKGSAGEEFDLGMTMADAQIFHEKQLALIDLALEKTNALVKLLGISRDTYRG